METQNFKNIVWPIFKRIQPNNNGEKLEILNTINENKIDLNELIYDYKEFYTAENKIHVVDVADEGLVILLKQLAK